MSFPNLRPSSRRFTPGDWPVKTFNSVNGSEFRILRGSNRVNAKLELEFRNISDANARLFLLDYYARQGTFKSWAFEPAASRSVFHGWDASGSSDEGDTTVLEAAPYGMQWRYEEEPQIEQVAPGVSTVSVKLIGIIQSTLPSIDITPITPIVPAVPKAPATLSASRGILINNLFLYSASAATYEGGIAVDGTIPPAYYGRTDLFGGSLYKNRVPGIAWSTDSNWTTAELGRISKWSLHCYRDRDTMTDDVDGRTGKTLSSILWPHPDGPELMLKDVSTGRIGIDLIDRFMADTAKGVGRQSLLEINNISVDDTVTSGVSWPLRRKSLPDGSTSFPSDLGNNWGTPEVKPPTTKDTWVSLAPGAPFWNETIGWAGPQGRNGASPTRYFFVVMAIDSAGKLLSVGVSRFSAINIPS